MRKIIIIVLIILVVLGGIWIWWRGSQAPEDGGVGDSSLDTDNGSFFPSGQPLGAGTGTDITGPTGTGTQPDGTGTTGDPNLSLASGFNKISSGPVAGASLVGNASSSMVIYMDKARGHLFGVRPDDLLSSRQLSNTTIPKVEELLIGETTNNASTTIQIIARYQTDNRLQNFSAALIGLDSGTINDLGELEGSFLSPNITQIATSPQKDRIFYLEDGRNNTTGYLANWDGTGKVEIFSSPLSEWLISWPNEELLALQTKTASNLDSLLYTINTQTKTEQLVFNRVPGLSTLLSPNGRQVLYSGNTRDGLAFGVYPISENLFKRLLVNTLAEKCVWSSDNVTIYCGVPVRLPLGSLPDGWYRGEFSFTDNIWKIDTDSGKTEIIYNPELANLGRTLDATKLFLDAKEENLFLINKTDQELWALDLGAAF